MNKKMLGICLVIVVAVLAFVLTRGGGDNNSAPTGNAPADSAPAASSTPASTETSASEPEYNLRLGFGTPPGHPINDAIAGFITDVDEQTNGRVKITPYGNNILGGEREVVEGVQLGNIDMSICSSSPLVNFDPSYLIFDLPFLFATQEEASAAMDGEFGQNILKNAENYNLVALGFWQWGFLDFVGNRKIEKMDDLKGMVLRCMESKLTMSWLAMYGVNPVPMPYSEVFTGIQNGTVDGTLLAPSTTHAANIHTVSDYFCVMNTGFSPAVFIMNKELFDGMPSDIQAVIAEGAKKFGQMERQAVAEKDGEYLKIMSDAGCETVMIAPEEKQRFSDFARTTVYPKLVSEGLISQEVIDACLASAAAGKK